MPETHPRKLLALCDSPTCNTGFGRVSSNLLSRWHESGFFDEIHVWGIGCQGLPHDLPYKLWPAARVGDSSIWWEPQHLQRFLNLANNKDQGFTHVWMMHDTFTLRPLAEPLMEMRKTETSPRTFYYYPLDAVPRRDWLRIVESVDVPVAYTEWGRRISGEVFSDFLRQTGVKGTPLKGAVSGFEDRIRVLYHGVDNDTYHSIGEEAREQARQARFGGSVDPDDLLLVVVNSHQKRKGLPQALETFKELISIDRPERRDRWKIYFHMPQRNSVEGTDLALMAESMGLPANRIFYGDNYFVEGYPAMPESTLNEIYNCADLVLNTTLGEGWGLTLTEAMSAGACVAAPIHTAMTDYFHGQVGIPLPIGGNLVLPNDNSLPRPFVDPKGAAEVIAGTETAEWRVLGANAAAHMMEDHFQWDNIASGWLDLFA